MTTAAHQAVLDLMLTDPERIWPSAEIAARLNLPPHIVSGRLRSLALTLDVQKVATSRYRLPTPGALEPVVESPAPEVPQTPTVPPAPPEQPAHSALPTQDLGRVDQDAVQRLRDRHEAPAAPAAPAPAAPPPPAPPVSDLELEQFALKVKRLTEDRRKGTAPGAETLAGRLHWSLARTRATGDEAVRRGLVKRDLYGRYRPA